MQTEARVGVVVGGGDSGGQRVLNSGHGAAAVDGGIRSYSQQHHRQHQQRQQSLHQQSQIGTVSQLLAGGIAGAVSKTCTAPLARLTILFQVQGMHSDVTTLKKASIWREASRIAYEEGFRAFWKGNLVTIAHRLPYSSISFYAYDRYKNLLQLIPGLDKHQENVSADLCVRLAGGGLSGITAASITYPLDLVRTRLAAQDLRTRFVACNFTNVLFEETYMQDSRFDSQRLLDPQLLLYVLKWVHILFPPMRARLAEGSFRVFYL
ncbi:hypothetical protein ACLOJK_012596 [Asimina triloba]